MSPSVTPDVVHLGLFDASGTLREKRLSRAAADRALHQGWSFIDAVNRWDAADGVWGATGAGHAAARVDPTSARPHPFDPAASLWIADFVGDLETLSPRHHVQRLEERARSLGLEVAVAFETECIVLDMSAGEVVADAPLRLWAPANRCWSARTPASVAEVLFDLWSCLEAGDVALDHTCSELGPGCLELATAPSPPVRAADDAALLKVWTKAFFDRRGLTATFMAQPAEDLPGLGCHPSLSLRSAEDGEAVLATGPGELTELGRRAVAGVVRLLPELFLLVAATPNAYRRFAPGNWAPATASWGLGNYSCGLRVVCDTPAGARLELRAPGADVSPHLCLAMFLAAVLFGIEHRLEPPPPVSVPADARRLGGTEPVRFPRSLPEAADRFSASTVAPALFGPAFVAHHLGAASAEDAACRRFVPMGERRRYLLEA